MSPGNHRTLWQTLGERRYLATAAQHEAEIRAELIAAVRAAILNAPPSAGYGGPRRDVAEIAVDALADYYRAQLNTQEGSQ